MFKCKTQITKEGPWDSIKKMAICSEINYMEKNKSILLKGCSIWKMLL